MNYGRSLTWVAISAFLFCFIGAIIGYATGVLMPEYYQSMFNKSHEPGFDAVAVGLGEGLLRGFMWGTYIGIVLAGLQMWKEYQMFKLGDPVEEE